MIQFMMVVMMPFFISTFLFQYSQFIQEEVYFDIHMIVRRNITSIVLNNDSSVSSVMRLLGIIIDRKEFILFPVRILPSPTYLIFKAINMKNLK